MKQDDDRPLLSVWPTARLTLCAALVACAVLPAQAGWFDGLLGQDSSGSSPAGGHQRLWLIGEFSQIQLVPREAGGSDNQQPVRVQADALRQQLAQVQVELQGGSQPLFSDTELAALVGPLVQALAQVGPGDDVLLLSSARREGGFLSPPTAVTARLFVQDASLQFIVHDARMQFYDTYRGTNIPPHFVYGSRATVGEPRLQSSTATAKRNDWLLIPMTALAAAAPVSPAVAPIPPAVTVTPPPGAAARAPLDAAAAQDIERRLETLKRLREKGLITEDEYQQKRKEILQLL